VKEKQCCRAPLNSCLQFRGGAVACRGRGDAVRTTPSGGRSLTMENMYATFRFRQSMPASASPAEHGNWKGIIRHGVGVLAACMLH